MIILKLFLSFLQIGMFSVGGGYAAIPLIQDQAVNIHGWLKLSEFTDLITIAEMTPGPIAVNSATFVGLRVAGYPGALISTFGCILPSCIIVTLLAHIYYKYRDLTVIQGVLSSLRPAVVALIASAGLTIFMLSAWDISGFAIDLAKTNYLNIILFVAALFTLRKTKSSPILVMVSCGILYMLYNIIFVGI